MIYTEYTQNGQTLVDGKHTGGKEFRYLIDGEVLIFDSNKKLRNLCIHTIEGRALPRTGRFAVAVPFNEDIYDLRPLVYKFDKRSEAEIAAQALSIFYERVAVLDQNFANPPNFAPDAESDPELAWKNAGMDGG